LNTATSPIRGTASWTDTTDTITPLSALSLQPPGQARRICSHGSERLLGRDAKGYEFVIVDRRKGLGIATALEIERLVFGAGDVDDWPGFRLIRTRAGDTALGFVCPTPPR
jgi:hypothetical protein